MSTNYFIDHDSIYSTGLLSASTSRFISTCLRAKKDNNNISLNEEDKILLKNAKEFLTDIITGKNLVSQQTVSPTVDGIMAVNYAIQVVPRETIGEQKAPATLEELTEYFESILSVLSKVSETNITDIPENKLYLTHRFFSKIADMFLDKVQTFARAESKIFQSL